MQPKYTYEGLLETSRRVNWRVEDLIGGEKRLDFKRPFLAESFARTRRLEFLSAEERLGLNHVRSRGYLAMFELVERFIVPFVIQQSDTSRQSDAFCKPALDNFAAEEVKHMDLFRRFCQEFDAGFGFCCSLIGPAEDIAAAVLKHSPLAVAIAVLGLELMSQSHYLESVKDDQQLDPQFKSLLKAHWIEEAQHAKLDTLLLRAMLVQSAADEIDAAMDEYFEIGAFFDEGFKQQAVLDLASFQQVLGRALDEEHEAQFLEVQHQALRWTFLGSTMRNRNFLETLGSLNERARRRVEDAAAALC